MSEIYLKFNEKERYDIKIETLEEMNSSIFVDSYVQAYKELNTISSENVNEIDRNNIIAFLGERGSGKTSCMRSFLGALKNLSKHKFYIEEENDELKKSLEKLSEIDFEVLTIIEPSFFSEKVNVVELVISNMFKNFRKKIEENSNEHYEKKKELLQKFQEVFKNMKYMKCSEEYKNSEIEELMDLSTSVDFKNNLKDLIVLYLSFFSKNKLIISIDDIDLNTKFAYSMIEDVRKYLSIPNAIIILALKLEQLKAIIKKEYIIENNDLLSKTNNNYIINDIENRVEKYLLKLIPYERRIFLKNPDDYGDNVKIFIGNEEINAQDEKFQDKVLNFIYKKTNMLFLKPEYGVNKIIPTSLRELVGFMAIVRELEECLENDTKLIKEKNYKIFKNYLYTYLFQDKLSGEEQNIVKMLLSKPYNKKNSYIVSALEALITGSNNRNIQENIDIIKVIKKIEEIENKSSYFSFFLKLVYSNMLYETYHEKENKNNFHNLIGKDYLLDFDKYILFNVNEKKFKKIIEDNECQMLDIFLLKSKNEGNQNEKFKEEVSFSLVAPFYNFIFENNLNLKNFIFRNMEIYEQFYLFLENVDFNKTSNDFKDILEDLQTFYNQKINYFVERLPSVLRSSFEEDLLILKEKVINKISIEKLKELEEIIRNANSEKETNASIK